MAIITLVSATTPPDPLTDPGKKRVDPELLARLKVRYKLIAKEITQAETSITKANKKAVDAFNRLFNQPTPHTNASLAKVLAATHTSMDKVREAITAYEATLVKRDEFVGDIDSIVTLYNIPHKDSN
jgi:hypothetical protein